MVREEFPQVRLIQNSWNSGFAHAINQGLRAAQGEIFILLNADMKVGGQALEKVFDILTSRKDIGVLGIKLLKEDGTVLPSVRRDPDFWSQLAILFKLPHFFKLKKVEDYLAKDFDYDNSSEVEQVRGSFFAFNREVLDKVGFFDEKNFFFWFEEVDFCRRVRLAGYKIWYEAGISGLDLVGRSVRQLSLGKKQAIFFRSLTNYFFKWHPWWQGAVFFLLRFPLVALAYLVDWFWIH
jgi:GT2 family glycosyltransferase